MVMALIQLILQLCLALLAAGGTPLERIHGGRDVEPGEASFQLSLQFEDGQHLCGASLVEIDGFQFAVSATHCFRFEGTYQMYAIAGDIDLNDHSGSEQRRKIIRVVTHPDFVGSHENRANDIALLFFDSPFLLNRNVSTINFPPRMLENNADEELVVTGYGKLNPSGPLAQHLQLVELEQVDDNTCKEIYSSVGINIVPSMVCAGRVGGVESPCEGDSGSPARGRGTKYLIGVVSFGAGDGCRYSDYPAVFTEVAFYLEWMKEEIIIFHRGIHVGNFSSAI